MASREITSWERGERIARSCEAANGSADVAAIEGEWDAMTDKADEIEEPWTIALPR